MEFNCTVCNRTFADQKKLDKHLASKLHLRRAVYSGKVEIVEKPKPFSLISNPKDNKYSIDNILKRENTDLPMPKENWKKFINTAYTYDGDTIKLITCSEKHIEKAANLLLAKLMNTRKELLPLLVINKSGGANKRIAYYEGEPNFTIRTGVSKKDNIQLFNQLDIYLSRSVGMLWYEPKLREIYRSLPIEIRNKIWYRCGDDDKLSFLDFFCVEKNCRHMGCWNSHHYSDGKTVYWKYKNKELVNVDGGKFTLNDDDYLEFRREFGEHVMDHENYDTYIKFRNEQKECYFSSEMCEIQDNVLEELFIQVSRICNVNTILSE